MTFWTKFKLDFKERFLKFETIRGIVLIPGGLIGLYLVTFNISMAYIFFGYIFFGYMLLDGLRKFFVNRAAQDRKMVARQKERQAHVEKSTNSS